MALLARPGEETDDGMFELMVNDVGGSETDIDVTWKQVEFNIAETDLDWSASNPLRY